MSGTRTQTPKLVPVDYDPFAKDSPTIPQLIWGASNGRNGDTLLGHLTAGDVVIPSERVTPAVQTVLSQLLGVDRNKFTVGTQDNSINPATGLREFGEDTGGGNDGNGNSGGSEAGSGTGDGGAGGTGNTGDGGVNGIDPGKSDIVPNSPPSAPRSSDDELNAAVPATDEARANAPAQTNPGYADEFAPSPPAGPMEITGIGMVDKAINKAIDNPISTIANFGFGMIPGVGQINSALGMFNSVTGFNAPTFGSSLAAIGSAISNDQGVGVSGDAGGGDSSGRGGSGEDNASTYYEQVTRPNADEDERQRLLASLGVNPLGAQNSVQQNTQQASKPAGYNNPVHSIQGFLNDNPFTAADYVSKNPQWV